MTKSHSKEAKIKKLAVALRKNLLRRKRASKGSKCSKLL